MWEPMHDDSPDRKGINVSAQFWFSIAHSREEALRKFVDKHLKVQNKVEYFTTHSYQSLGNAKVIKKDVERFKTYLKDNEIKDIKLIPMNDFKDIFMRIVRFKKVRDLDTSELLSQFCYHVMPEGICENV